MYDFEPMKFDTPAPTTPDMKEASVKTSLVGVWVCVAFLALGLIAAITLAALAFTKSGFTNSQQTNLKSLADNIYMQGQTLFAPGFTDDGGANPFLASGGALSAQSVASAGPVTAASIATSGTLAVNGGAPINAFGSTINSGFVNVSGSVNVSVTPSGTTSASITPLAISMAVPGTTTNIQAGSMVMAGANGRTTTVTALGISNSQLRYQGTRYMRTGSIALPLDVAIPMGTGSTGTPMFPQTSGVGFGNFQIGLSELVANSSFRITMNGTMGNTSGSPQVVKFILSNTTVPPLSGNSNLNTIFLGADWKSPAVAPKAIGFNMPASVSGDPWSFDLDYIVTLVSFVGSTASVTSTGKVQVGQFAIDDTFNSVSQTSTNNIMDISQGFNFNLWADFPSLGTLSIQPYRIFMEQIS